MAISLLAIKTGKIYKQNELMVYESKPRKILVLKTLIYKMLLGLKIPSDDGNNDEPQLWDRLQKTNTKKEQIEDEHNL